MKSKEKSVFFCFKICKKLDLLLSYFNRKISKQTECCTPVSQLFPEVEEALSAFEQKDYKLLTIVLKQEIPLMN